MLNGTAERHHRGLPLLDGSAERSGSVGDIGRRGLAHRSAVQDARTRVGAVIGRIAGLRSIGGRRAGE